MGGPTSPPSLSIVSAEREIGAMIDGVIGNKLLAAEYRQDIIERTDGIPLFVEEMTRAVLEAETERKPPNTQSPAVPSLALPSLRACTPH